MALHVAASVSHAHSQLPYSCPPTPPASLHRIGFVGLGAMGYAMAKNLAVHNHSHPAAAAPILVYNRTLSKAHALHQELGDKVRVADSLEQLALECDVVFTCLASDQAVKDVYQRFCSAMKESPHSEAKIFVESSTCLPQLLSEIDAWISQVPHTHLIAAPVFGPPAVAAKAQLILVMSGDYRSKKVVAYLSVPAMARKVIDLGGNIEKAPTFKLIGNSMIIGSIELLAEAMTLAEKSGCGAEKFFEFVKDFFPAGPFLNYGPKMLADEFDGTKGFGINGGLKDTSHIRQLATACNSPMPIIDAAHRNMLTARAIHTQQVSSGTARYEVLDSSALVAGSRVAAGLPPFDINATSRVVKED